jgi:hypothetical protein
MILASLIPLEILLITREDKQAMLSDKLDNWSIGLKIPTHSEESTIIGDMSVSLWMIQ